MSGPSPFVMHGAREAMASGLAHIERHIIAIENAVTEEPGLAFDLARTLVESTCRAVLGERAIAYAEADDLPRLFKTATQHLPMLPSTASDAAEVRRSLQQTLTGLNTALQGICELRNQCGFASHGAGKPRPAMEAGQALLAAKAADAIVGFLHRVHCEDGAPTAESEPRFDDNGPFNDALDEEVGSVRIREVEFRASEVLWTMEPETYRIYLAEFDDGGDAEV
jgi:hypothetical protein